MSDLVKQALVSDGFWLAIFLVSAVLFRKELRLLLSSLASFKVAGASFELRDKRMTLEYYAILTNILVEILSQRDSAEKFYGFLSENSARQLAKFIQQYQKEIPEEEKDVELLKNVALLVGRKGNYQVAISLYDDLLKRYPEDRDLLYLKARMLRDSRVQKNIEAAEAIYEELVSRYPSHGGIWFGRARAKSLLGKLDDSIHDLEKAITFGYWRNNPKMLEDSQLQPLGEGRPNEFDRLRAELNQAATPAA